MQKEDITQEEKQTIKARTTKVQNDQIKKWLICSGRVLITAAKTTNLIRKASKLHNLTKTTTAVLGRCLTMMALMGTKLSSPKANITAVIQGDGPVGKITAVAMQNAVVKGYMQNPNVELNLNDKGKLDVGGAVGKNGKLRVAMDLGFGYPYSGEVDLVSGEIAEDFTHYYYHSLQQPCAICLGVLVDKDNTCISGAGLLIEVLPDATEEDIVQVEQIVAKLNDFSKIMQDKTLEDFATIYLPNCQDLQRDFTPKFECKCSKAKLKKIIKGLSEQTIREIFEKDDTVFAHCDFCNKTIGIDKKDILG